MATAQFQIEAGSVQILRDSGSGRFVRLNVRFAEAGGGFGPFQTVDLFTTNRDEARALLEEMTREHDRRMRAPASPSAPSIPTTPLDVTVPDTY